MELHTDELVPEVDEASICVRAEQPAASSASKAMAASLMAAILALPGAPQAVIHRGPCAFSGGASTRISSKPALSSSRNAA